MDSDDDGFATKGGDALDLGEEFSDSEEDDDAPPMRQPMPQSKNMGTGNVQRKPDPRDAAKGAQVKGQKVDN
jgi:intraflagellar transport protein 46